ncbi:hypothetical protein [Granulicella arctica]|uniref:UbiA prenyltransferase family protein n=1 Tax=Granulicella arctica TaxID=940613 RepID=A0A7Y9PJW8_9BACT|nr:hypothetical protein [Granulicella arctica]NYF81293.1 hypothetical protein [Granulicella arctica]
MATAPHIPYPSKTPLPFPPPRKQQSREQHNPLTLWHLLSLDAPTVAALWTWFLARANHIHLPPAAIAAMSIAVWLLYATDRLLDSRTTDTHTLEARHHFHHRHRRAFLTTILLSAATLAALLPRLTPASIRLYLIEGSFLVAYFILIHATRSAHRLPKEFAVGLFFAAATFIPTISREPSLRLPLLAPAILFSALCSLNCLFIYAWEHHSSDPTAHLTTRIALQSLKPLATALLLASTALTLLDHQAPWPIPASIALSTAALLLLHRYRHTIPATTLRAAADLALLTPALFVFFL